MVLNNSISDPNFENQLCSSNKNLLYFHLLTCDAILKCLDDTYQPYIWLFKHSAMEIAIVTSLQSCWK